MNPKPPLFFITGPTGVGKTGIAAGVAARCQGEIIGADAFQIYRGMDILTAKPSRQIREQIPHHLIDIVPAAQAFDVARYLALAGRAASEITGRGKLPVVAGGTGLYVRALTHGLSDLPKADAAVRARLEELGLEELQTEFKRLDPTGAQQIDLKNKRRLIRAIEVCELTGKPFSSFRDDWEKSPGLVSGVLLTRDREDLHARIDRRVEAMVRDGLLDEVRALQGEVGPTAGQAIGLRETQACLNGKITLNECIAQIQLATRQYAKRQLTWFRRDPLFEEINLSRFENIEEAILTIVEKAQTR